MKKSYVIIIIAIALLAVWYFFFRTTSNTAAANVLAGSGNAPDGSPASGAATTPATNATATAPSQILTSTGTTGPLPQAGMPGTPEIIDPSQYDAIILPWMNSLGVANKAQALGMYPNMTAAEKGALADIIVNVWGGNRPETNADTAFWNAWRTKYHILDGTYSPFNGGVESDQMEYTGVNNGFKVTGSPVDYEH